MRRDTQGAAVHTQDQGVGSAYRWTVPPSKLATQSEPNASVTPPAKVEPGSPAKSEMDGVAPPFTRPIVAPV